MRFLKTNTATIVTVGPFLDKTDGVTLENGLTITNERISFTVDSNAGSAPTLVLDNITGATSGTDNDLNYITNCDAGLMQLELSAANTNYLGRAYLTITDATNHCPVFHEFTILPALVYDSLIAGSDNLQVDAVQLNGTAQTARDIGASVLLSSGSGTGQVSLSSGAVTVGTNNDKTGYSLTATTGLGDQTANITGNLSGSVGSISTGGITAASIATGAIDADALAADAVNEIADGVWDEARSGHTSAGTFGEGLASVQGNVTGSVASVTGAVGSVTGNVGGSVASVTAGVTLADNAITAGKFDESTAFPLTSADTGSTAVARTGADGDTLETLSDQLDAVESETDGSVWTE